MITTLIGIQTILIGTATVAQLFKSKDKKVKLKLISNENGFKIYKVKGGN
jgi:hypothetical protein